MRTIRYLLLLLLFWAPPALAQESCARPVDRPFRMFSLLHYADMPDFGRHGIERAHIIDRGIWPEGRPREEAPDPALVRQVLAALPDDGAPVVLDFELLYRVGNAGEIAASRARLGHILSLFRQASPRRPIGFYHLIPMADYWRAYEGPQAAGSRAWQRTNDQFAAIERGVDMLFPSLYTFYEDRAGWVAYATAQICEARRLSDKPVYVFLWPEYHDGANPQRGALVPGSYWRLQLETALRLADGVVLWGGYDLRANRSRRWNPDSEWWLETMRFMADRQRRR